MLFSDIFMLKKKEKKKLVAKHLLMKSNLMKSHLRYLRTFLQHFQTFALKNKTVFLEYTRFRKPI